MANVYAAIEDLVKIGLDIASHLKGERLWVKWLRKFQMVLVGTEETKRDVFVPVFQAFLRRYRTLLTAPVFRDDEEGDPIPNDDYLRFPSDIGTKKTSWAQQACRGIVIPYDHADPRMRAVAIPLTEIYEDAIRLHKEGDFISYPSRLLAALYHVLILVCPDTDPTKPLLISNHEALVALIDDGAENVGGAAAGEGAMNGLGAIMGKLLKGDGLSSMFGEQGMASEVGSLVEKLSSKIDPETKADDLGSVISQVVTSLQAPDIAASLAAGIEKLGGQAQSMMGAMPEFPVDVSAAPTRTDVPIGTVDES